jgi:hypothetical protein
MVLSPQKQTHLPLQLKASLYFVEPLLPSGVEVWQRACPISFCLVPVIRPVCSPLPSRAMHFGCCPAIWSEVCLWFFCLRIKPPTPCVDILTRASSLHDEISGAESVIVEVSRSVPSGSSGCALCPFWSFAPLFVRTSSQLPGVYCAALLLVSTTLHYKSE